MSLRFRLAVTVGLAVATAIGLAAVVAQVVASRELVREIDGFLTMRAEEAATIEQSPQPDQFRRRTRDRRLGGLLDTPDSIVQLIQREGIVVGLEGAIVLPVEEADRTLAAAPGPSRIRTETVGETEFRMITAWTPVGAIQIARDLSEVDNVAARIRSRLLMIWLLGTGLAVLAGWLVASRTVGPVLALTESAERIAATDDLTQRIDNSGRDEVGRLGSAFNSMLAALDLSRSQQRRFVQDASHELRTPLTSIRTNLDVLGRGIDRLTPADRDNIVADLRSEAEELTTLVSQLVDHASGSSIDTPAEPVDLAAIATEVVARFSRRSGRAIDLELVTSTGTDMDKMGEPQLGYVDELERAVANLVGNAVKFTPESSPIEVVVTPTSVECRDRGPGIPPADLDRIFDRFYRPDESRSTSGSGLGLAIVAQAAAKHRGRTWAQNRQGGGAAIGFEINTA